MELMNKVTQKSLIASFFRLNPDRDIETNEVVDWATAEWTRRTGKVLRDPDRAIRLLHAEGLLIKVNAGVYRFDLESVNKPQQNFTHSQRQEILKRDGYRCVLCGQPRAPGVQLHVDHIVPKKHGGTATIENGQTLCSKHNMLKGSLQQTETGKKMFIRLYELAKSRRDERLIAFLEDILSVYKKHGINGHIDWQE